MGQGVPHDPDGEDDAKKQPQDCSAVVVGVVLGVLCVLAAWYWWPQKHAERNQSREPRNEGGELATEKAMKDLEIKVFGKWKVAKMTLMMPERTCWIF